MGTRGTILVVGSEAGDTAAITEPLGAAGYRVLTAAPVQRAPAILRAFRVQLVIVAPRPRPGADPWAELDALVRAAGEVRCLLCDPGDAGEYDDYAAHGFAACLPCPPTPTELLALVAALPSGGRSDAVARQATRQG